MILNKNVLLGENTVTFLAVLVVKIENLCVAIVALSEPGEHTMKREYFKIPVNNLWSSYIPH